MMTLTKVKDPKASYFADYKKMRFYMKQEAYWHEMSIEASILIEKVEVEGYDCTFQANNLNINQLNYYLLVFDTLCMGSVHDDQ